MSELDQELTTSLLDSLVIEDTDEFDTPAPKPNHKRSERSFRESVQREPKLTPTGRVSHAKEPPARKDEFVEPLTEFYTLAGVLVTPFDNVCGPVIIESAPTCAKSLQELAEKNDSVRRALRTLTQVSIMGQVIAAHAPILLAVIGHHMPGALPKPVSEPSREESEQPRATVA